MPIVAPLGMIGGRRCRSWLGGIWIGSSSLTLRQNWNWSAVARSCPRRVMPLMRRAHPEVPVPGRSVLVSNPLFVAGQRIPR